MSSTDEIQIRTVAEQAARTAGSFIRLMALDNLKVFKAGEISKPGKFLSVFDKEAERLIRNTIKMHFPDSDVFTDADIDKRFSSSEFSKITWFVDPLDGSKAFLKGQFAFVCLSLAAWDP
ncbi:MAG TPA: inositol monophosphatase family protein, partial [Candidatus Hodarchaeales archaeon]|nr:inositol monophosphatase family protein [Candidatus Hodarchaeales archaeon]